MWRALFLAMGFYSVLLGIQCLGVEKFTLVLRDDPPVVDVGLLDKAPSNVGPKKVITPKEWSPWSLLAGGAVVCLYSFTLPSRLKGA